MRNQPLFILTLRALHKSKINGIVWTIGRIVSTIKQRISAAKKQYSETSDEVTRVSTASPNEIIEIIKNEDTKNIKVATIQIEITRFCNLRCPGCLLTIETEKGNWPAEHMDSENFNSICDNLPAAESMRLFNYGEPSMNPKFMEMIRYTKKTKKFDKIVSTSNLLSHTPEYFNELFDAGLDFLSISVDSLDQEIADKLRTRTKVDKLKENLEYLILKRPKQINISTVVSMINLGDLENLFRFLNNAVQKTGETLEVSPMTFNDYFAIDQAGKVVDIETINKELTRLQLLFLNLNINLLSENECRATSICTQPWSNLNVNVKGEITPCHSHHEVVVSHQECGYLRDQPYEKIINSPAMIKFFSSYIKKSPDFCSVCPNNFER